MTESTPKLESDASNHRRLYGLGLAAGITRKVFRRFKKSLRRFKKLRSKVPTSENLVRKYPDLVGALSDDFPVGKYMLRPETLPFLVGDYAMALRLTRRRFRQGDPQAVFIALVSKWSLAGNDRLDVEQEAHNIQQGANDDVLTGIARFYIYLERPDAAQQVVDLIRYPSETLLRIVGSAWRRHGQPEQAINVLSAVQSEAGDGLDRQIEAARGEQAALEWEWAAGGSINEYTPIAGRVLHMVSRSLPHHHAGSTYRTHYTLTAQREAGIDAHAVTECGFPPHISSNGKYPSETYDGVEYLRIPEPLDDRQLDARLKTHFHRALSLATDIRPAVLHPHSDFKNAGVALAVGNELGIPVVYEVRGFPEVYLPRRPASSMLYERHGHRKKMEAECWRRADRIVTLAEVMKDHIASYGIDRQKIEVVPNAVDIDKFAPAQRDSALAHTLTLDSADVVLGYVSSLTAPYEGIQYLIAAVAELQRRGTNAKALIVGDGSERHHLTEFATRLEVQKHIVFTGRIDHADVPRHYSLIDIFVVPRTSEATTELVTPLKPLEAMSMERAVVVAGTAALSEMIVEGETGLSYIPDNVESLVSTVEPLIEDPARRRRLGAQAREWVAENRAWKHNAARYKQIYEDLGITVGMR